MKNKFLEAAKANDLILLKSLTNGDTDFNWTDDMRRTAMHWFAWHGHEAAVKFLLDQGANPNLINWLGWTPLHCAVHENHVVVVNLLVKNGADISIKSLSEFGNCPKDYSPKALAALLGHSDIPETPEVNAQEKTVGFEDQAGAGQHLAPEHSKDLQLISAVGSGDAAAVIELLAQGADVNVMIEEADPKVDIAHPYPLLVYALYRKDINHAVIAALLSQQPDVNKASIKGYTPLMAAAAKGHESVFNRLLSMGANVEALHSNGSNLLMYAAQGGSFSLVRRLKEEYGIDPHNLNTDGDTTLLRAALGGHVDMVRYLHMECKVDPNQPDNNGATPFKVAAERCHLEVAQYLYAECKADPNQSNKQGVTPLHSTAGGGHLDAVRYLHEKCQADPGRLMTDGRTPLHFAADNNYLEIVRYLCDVCKINPSVEAKDQKSPLYLAVIKGHLSIVSCLLERGADVSNLKMGKENALTIAEEKGYTDILRLLLKAGAVCENLGLAIQKNQLDKVKYYFDLGAPFDHITRVRSIVGGEYQSSSYTRSYISLAIESDATDVVDFLLSVPGATELNNNNLRLPLLIAVEKNNLNLCRRLVNLGAQPEKFSVSYPVLYAAAQTGNLALFEYFNTELNIPIKTAEKDDEEPSLLFAAVTGGNFEIFQRIYRVVGGDLSRRTEAGLTFLHLACAKGDIAFVTYLLDQVAYDINDNKNPRGETPLFAAIRSGSLSLVRFLIERGANAAACLHQDSDVIPGATVIHYAASEGQADILSYFLSEECETAFDLDARSKIGLTALMSAAIKNRVNCIYILLREGANIDAQRPIDRSTGNGGFSALIFASCHGHYESVDALLEYYADVNLQCGEGHPAIFYAIPCAFEERNKSGDGIKREYTEERFARAEKVVRALLAVEDLKPNLYKRDTRWNYSALDEVIRLGHLPLAKLLIEDPRVNINDKDSGFFYPLLQCILRNNLELAELLLGRKDCDPNLVDSQGENSLVVAERKKLTGMITLIKAHPNFRVTNDSIFVKIRNDDIAWLRAAFEKDPDIVEKTMEQGENLLFIACDYGHLNIAKLIVTTWQANIERWIENKEWNLIAEKIQSRWHVSWGNAASHWAGLAKHEMTALQIAAVTGGEGLEAKVIQLIAGYASAFEHIPEHYKIFNLQLRALGTLFLLDAGHIELEDCRSQIREVLEVIFFNEPNKENHFPLMEAGTARKNCFEMVSYLLSLDSVYINLECIGSDSLILSPEHQFKKASCSGSGDAPVLLWVADNGEIEGARALLASSRLDINKHSRCVSWDGHNSLTRVLSRNENNSEMIALMILKARPDVDVNYRIADWSGAFSALTLAAMNGYADVVTCLLTFPAIEVNICNSRGKSPLMCAVENAKINCLRLLVADLRVDVNQIITKDYDNLSRVGFTALHFAALKGAVDCLESLFTRKDLIREPRTAREQWTPLMIAAKAGNIKTVSKLIEQGADIYAQDIDGLTARFLALQFGRMNVAAVLLEKEQEIEAQKNQKKQDELTDRIAIIDEKSREEITDKNRLERRLSQHSHEIKELQTTVKQHAENIKTLYQDREVLLAERLVLQQMAEATAYLQYDVLLKAFYNHLQSKLTELFLAYKSLASGMLVRAETTTDAIANKVIEIAGNAIPFVGGLVSTVGGAVYEMVRDSQEKKICDYISAIFTNTDDLTQLIKITARLTAYKLETQIKKFANEQEACCFAECVVGYYFGALRDRAVDLNGEQSIYSQLSHCLLSYEAAGVFAFIREKTLQTNPLHQLPKWTVRGVLKESGIATKQGICFARSECKIVSYGYRLGTEAEAENLGYAKNTDKISSAHPLSSNPFRYEEKVESSVKMVVLTWESLLQNLRQHEDHQSCVESLRSVGFQAKKVVVMLSDQLPRKNLLKFAACLAEQAKQVSDQEVGQPLQCELDGHCIELEMKNGMAAELLCGTIQECWPITPSVEVTIPPAAVRLIDIPLAPTIFRPASASSRLEQDSNMASTASSPRSLSAGSASRKKSADKKKSTDMVRSKACSIL